MEKSLHGIEAMKYLEMFILRIFFVSFRGKGDYYRLGHGTTDAVTTPTAISELEDVCVIQVAVGALHTLALSNTGEVSYTGLYTYICR